MDKLYNTDIKERYLNERFGENEGSQKTIRHLFYKSEMVEDILDKDLFNFNVEEIGKVILNSNPHSSNVARAYGRTISRYISWAIDNGFRDDNLNPLRSVALEYYDQFVDKTKKIHYSFDEFIDLLESLKNDQDKALLFLFFEGIIGRSFSQIRELKISDIRKETNEIYVKERDEWIKVQPQCIDYLYAAHEQKVFYTFKDGDYNESELLPSEFIFKNVKSPRSQPGVSVNPSVLYTRINSIKESHLLEYLTPNALRQSGMIFYATVLYKRDREVRYDQLAEIGEKYQFNKLTSKDNFSYYNTNLMKTFLNSEVIEDLYGMEIIIEKR